MDIDVKDPKFLRWAGAILVVAVALPMYFMSSMYPFTYASRSQTIVGLETRHNELSRDLEKARLLVRNLERVEQEYAILHEQWKVAQTLLPEENQMPNLLRKVSAAGQQSGVDFELFKPQVALPRGFYADNPIEVRIRGGYHQTGVFLSRLANLNRIVNVSQISMEGQQGQEGNTHTLSTGMTLTAYTLSGGSQPVESPAGQADIAAAGVPVAKTGNTTATAATAAAGH